MDIGEPHLPELSKLLRNYDRGLMTSTEFIHEVLQDLSRQTACDDLILRTISNIPTGLRSKLTEVIQHLANNDCQLRTTSTGDCRTDAEIEAEAVERSPGLRRVVRTALSAPKPPPPPTDNLGVAPE